MPAAVQELHSQGLEFPVLVGGAAINRNFGRRILYPNGTTSDEIYEPGVFYCKDAFEGLNVVDQLVDGDARQRLVEEIRDEGKKVRGEGEEPGVLPTDYDSVSSAARIDGPAAGPPFCRVGDIPVALGDVF